MGAGASRELEQAQMQVKRLSSEMQRLNATLLARESKLSDVQREASQLRQYQEQLAITRRELDVASADLRSARRAAHDLPSVSAELRSAKGEVQRESRRVAELQAELQASRDELEKTVGQLKYAEQEQRSLARKIGTKAMTEEQRQLAAAQDEAATVSAQLVAEANAVLAGFNPHETHPVFGRLLYDYGHKRLYSASPTTLWAGTTMWHKQRAFRAARAELIAKAKLRSKVAGWPGAICVVESGVTSATTSGNDRGEVGGKTASPGEVAPHANGMIATGMIVDGQHRLGAAHVLASQGKLTALLGQILVEVYPPMEEQRVRELFTEINRMEPVTLVDLPEDQGGAGAEEESIITEAAERLRQSFPAMFKPSTNCRPPHLNVDILRNEIHKAGLIGKLGIASGEELIRWLEDVNSHLASRSSSIWQGEGGKPRFSEAVLSKANREGFYLGLGFGWLDRANLVDSSISTTERNVTAVDTRVRSDVPPSERSADVGDESKQPAKNPTDLDAQMTGSQPKKRGRPRKVD